MIENLILQSDFGLFNYSTILICIIKHINYGMESVTCSIGENVCYSKPTMCCQLEILSNRSFSQMVGTISRVLPTAFNSAFSYLSRRKQ